MPTSNTPKRGTQSDSGRAKPAAKSASKSASTRAAGTSTKSRATDKSGSDGNKSSRGSDRTG